MSQIKECFISRFPGGVIMEADFSQLEVIGLAALSMDPALIEDLLSGRDMHTYFAAQLFGVPESEVTYHQRKITKRFTFALQYGSGAGGLAKKNGTTVDVAAKFISMYYGRYSGVKQWQDGNVQQVKYSRTSTGEATPAGHNKGKGHLVSATGRVYVFFEQDAKQGFRDQTPSFNPPDIKNYPVQGFATGDVMAIYRGVVMRRMLAEGLLRVALPINTVHDSVMFDLPSVEVAHKLRSLLVQAAADLAGIIEETWGLYMPVPFKIETSIGPTWGQQEKMK